MDKFMPAVIVANHAVGLLLYRSFVNDEVEVNRVMIKEDGANNTLGQGFHERRTWHRFWHTAACTVVGALPAAAFVSREAMAWSAAALFVLLAGYFLRTFSPMLNAALKLDYKPRFYVSYSATASLLDRVVWWLSDTKLVTWLLTYGDRQARANHLFQILLNVCLVLTLVVYTLLVLPLLATKQEF
jgi:hypothetical protein